MLSFVLQARGEHVLKSLSKMRFLFRPCSLAVVLLLLGVACKTTGPYVWVDDYVERSPADRKPYVINPGDILQVRVFNQDQLTTRARVRGDGKVSLPLLNDVAAAGLTPVALAQQLQDRLKDFIKAPLVTVSLEEARTQAVYISGEVAKPGVYPLEGSFGVLQALVSAGGLTIDADRDRIFVLRQAPQAVRIRFTYQQLTRLEGKASTFRLEPGDIIVVE
jgi:polysaccharide biosynthesis/export protein